MTPLPVEDRAALKVRLAKLEKEGRDLLLALDCAVKVGDAQLYDIYLAKGYPDRLQEVQREIKRCRYAIKRAEIEGAA